MANAEQLKALVKSHIERDDQHFYSVAMQSRHRKPNNRAASKPIIHDPNRRMHTANPKRYQLVSEHRIKQATHECDDDGHQIAMRCDTLDTCLIIPDIELN